MILTFVQVKDEGGRKQLLPENCLEILESAEFLQMDDLVEESLDYLYSNIEEVIFIIIKN